MVVGYIVGTGVLMGGALTLLMAWATRALGPWESRRFHHLCQALIPLAGCGVFLGLSALTVSLLKNEGLPVFWAGHVRMGFLLGANLWSAWLALEICRQYSAVLRQRVHCLLAFGAALAVVDYSWALILWIW